MSKAKSKTKENCNDENASLVKSKNLNLRIKSPGFNFDMKSILKERQAENLYWKKNAEIDEELKIIDELFQKEIQHTIDIDCSPVLPTLGYVIFDYSKYNNIKVNTNSDTNSCSERFLSMSIEENELSALIHFHHLIEVDWLPEMDVCLFRFYFSYTN